MSPDDKLRAQLINTTIFCKTGRNQNFLRDPILGLAMLQTVLISKKLLSVKFLRENISLLSFPSACSVVFSQSFNYKL